MEMFVCTVEDDWQNAKFGDQGRGLIDLIYKSGIELRICKYNANVMIYQSI